MVDLCLLADVVVFDRVTGEKAAMVGGFDESAPCCISLELSDDAEGDIGPSQGISFAFH